MRTRIDSVPGASDDLGGARQLVQMSELETYMWGLGHRNWVILADAAYPYSSNPSIKTCMCAADLLATLDHMLLLLRRNPSIHPKIYVDSELPYVAESHAPGIDEFRKEFLSRLQPYSPLDLEHDLLLRRVREAARRYQVLVIKTQSMLPYTSVFLELECGYWTDEAEVSLRSSMALDLDNRASVTCTQLANPS